MLNTRVCLQERPIGNIKKEHFSLIEAEIPPLKEGEVLVKIEYVSLDPAMCGWMNEGTTYIRGVELGAVMRSFSAGTIIESKNPNFKKDDWVQGLLGVQQFAITDGKNISKIQQQGFALSWYLGILGMPGLTAYFGLLDKGKPQAKETIVISGAAGMVGSLVGQIGLLKNCEVIGIAGGIHKCNYIKNELGFTHAIDYKTKNVAQSLKQISPNGVNIYFDNVGGQILDDALLNLAFGARVVICGAISQYNDSNFNGLKNYMKIVSARGTLTGIIVLDYFNRAQEAIEDLGTWLQQGKIKYREHIVEGIENFVPTLNMLFTGENNGKLLLKV